MKKKKKQKSLAILLAVFAVLLGLFFLMKYQNEEAEKKKAQEEKEAEIHIYEADSLDAISYTDGTDIVSFQKTDGVWQYSPDPTIELTDSVVESMETAFCDIQAVKKMDEPDDLSDYGFDNPLYELSLTADGETRTFLVGNTSGEQYYFMEKDQQIVYTVASDIPSQMVWEMAEFAKGDSFVTVTSDNFVKEVIRRADGTETVFDAADEEQEETITSVANSFAAFYFTDCVDYHVTEDTLAQYGLDENNRTTVTVTYTKSGEDDEKTEETYTFYIGNKDSDGTYYYVQVDGSQRVSRVTSDNIAGILGQNAED